MKKLLFILSVFGLFTVYPDSKNQHTCCETIHKDILYAVQHRDTTLLKTSLDKLKQRNEHIHAGEILQVIMKDVFSDYRSSNLLGLSATMLIPGFLNGFKITNYDKHPNIFTFIGMLLAYTAFDYTNRFWRRKTYQILNMLISSEVCIKNKTEMAMLIGLCHP